MNAHKKFFVLKGCAGLGNRLSSLAWAIAYCKRNRRVLFVDWTDGTFGKRSENIFPKYFELRGVDQALSMDEFTHDKNLTVFPRVWKGAMGLRVWDFFSDDLTFLSKVERGWIRLMTGNAWKISNVWLRRDPSYASWRWFPLRSMSEGAWMPLMQSYPDDLPHDVVVACDYNPVFDKDIFLAHVFLREDMRQILANKAAALGIDKNTLGIHVRQTDWKWGASLEVLLEKIAREKIAAQGKMFLATDSQTALNKIKRVLPNVIVNDKFLSEGKEGDIGLHQVGYERKDGELAEKIFLDGLIDMFLLSRCGTLWHQEGSTFSMFAHIFSENPQSVIDWGKPAYV